MSPRTRQRRVSGLVLAVVTAVCTASGPARAQAPAAAPRLVLEANQPGFGPGASLAVTLGLQQAGAPVTVDLYFGAILPDGDTVVCFEGLGLAARPGRLSDLASLRPMMPGLAVATGTNLVVPDFFRYTWQGHEPPGTYQLFFAATTPGALRDGRLDGGDLLAMETQAILHLPALTVTSDAGHAGTASVGAGGGTVVTTGADGTVYTLRVPAGALAADTAITLTPVTGLSGWPAPVEVVAGVQGSPSGLRFARPATLEVTLPAPLEGDVFGMPLPDSGAGFDLVPVARSGNHLTVTVEHFSVMAIPRTLAELTALIAPSGFYAQALHLGGMASASGAAPAAVQALLTFLGTWHDTEVWPRFLASVGATGSGGDALRLAALAEFRRWEDRRVAFDMAFGMVGLDGAPARGRLVDRAEAGRQAALITLADGFTWWNDGCRVLSVATEDRLALADRGAGFVILGDSYLGQLETLQADPDVVRAPPLDLQAAGFTHAQIRASLCAAEVVHAVQEPAVPPGGTGALEVQAGVALAGQPVAVGPFMEVLFSADPASGAVTARAPTEADGVTRFPITADGDGHLRYRVCTFLRGDRFPSGLNIVRLIVDGEAACRSSVDGVVVTPAQVSIAPGASQAFTVVVEGTPNQAVTWSVSGGGAITPTGLFTSNGTTGVFYVQATSAEDPNAVGVAEVTVGSAPPPPPPDAPCPEGCTYSGTFTWCSATTPDQCTTYASGSDWHGHPRVFTREGTPPWWGNLSWGCISTRTGVPASNHAELTVQQGGSFTGATRPELPAECVRLASVQGTVTSQSLQFTAVESVDRITITFTGTRMTP